MEQRLRPQLAAILYADVAGYSRPTGGDEEGAHRRPGTDLDAISGSIRDHSGQAIDAAGDAVQTDFSELTDVPGCTTGVGSEFKDCSHDRPEEPSGCFNIGVNLGSPRRRFG